MGCMWLIVAIESSLFMCKSDQTSEMREANFVAWGVQHGNRTDGGSR
jgi:hypothetical protein